MMLHETMIEIARLGGGLDLDCSKNILFPDTMVAIAKAAADSGKRPTIIFRNVPTLFPDTAIKVVTAGQGCVVFAL
ncbi:hypothetical protein [Pseudochrobactrum saccharolyticum]|uniref:hypothetical protein n=1 Tax=Pseudochrobactrum saccharolyticum TaxID=354352 RepID=UPI002763F869|nr:hypothetical protein [Pseudochrobactrum saccharolyticum]MDP8250676.1 hypothetical protein [Pseudochrobactrum saccharolyticum]